MMKKRMSLLVFSLVITLVILACGLSGSMDVVNENSNDGTTNNVGDQGDQNSGDPAPADTDTPLPPPPEDTAAPTEPPEDTPVPTATTICDLVSFVSDITVPDGSKADPDESFTKTWRLRNAGSCTWTSGYDLVFHSGDAMGAPPEVQLTSGVVNPGDTVDVSVGLTAPSSPGTYKGFFKLRNSSGVIFGLAGNNPFWVEIEVKSPAAPPPAVQKPDLVITSIVLDPPTPTKGDPVQVKVSTYNIGNAVSGPYHVSWWPGKNYPSPACEWDVTNSNPNGGRVLSCTYAGYPSWYGSLDTKAVVDSLHTVDESNEGNNALLMNISVNP
jgi:hypothetical protein